VRRAKSPYAASGDISLHSFEVRRAAPEVLACGRTAPRAGWRRLLASSCGACTDPRLRTYGRARSIRSMTKGGGNSGAKPRWVLLCCWLRATH
jgi:hypothetical protein